MNKKNKILVGCLTLLLVLSVGYALFSEQVEINGTATAKGNFDIEFECTEYGAVGNTEATASCEISGQTIITKSTLTKPTDQTGYIITLTNNGTIPVLLKTVDSNNNNNNGYWDDEYNAPGDLFYFDETTFMVAFYNFDGSLGDFVSDSDAESQQIILQPEEQLQLFVSHMWMSTKENSITKNLEQPIIPEDGATISYNIKLGFEQVTAD